MWVAPRRMTHALLLSLLALPAPATPARPAGGAEGAPPPSAAADTATDRACLERVARRVQQRYESIDSLRAGFEQTTQVASLGSSQASRETASGSVVLAKPGKMRWSYEEPEPSLVVSDGETVWTYDPRINEVQKFPVGEGVLEGAAVQFLLGEGDILEQFEVSGGACGEDPAQLVLRPREPASYQRLEIEADPESGQVRATTVADLIGNVTRIRFHDVETGIQLDKGTFELKPPPGASVIEMGRME